jgi:hypothetical protein
MQSIVIKIGTILILDGIISLYVTMQIHRISRELILTHLTMAV